MSFTNIRWIFKNGKRPRICITMIHTQKLSIVHLYKLVQRQARISICSITNLGKLIDNIHVYSIYGKSCISLSPMIHSMAGSDKEIISIHSHSGRPTLKWNCSIASKKTTGSQIFPVFCIFRNSENFFGIISSRIFVTSKNIIIVITFVKCAKNR